MSDTQRPLFNIQRLAQPAPGDTGEKAEELIDIYLVLKGGLKIADKQPAVDLADNTLYWACHQRSPKLKMARNTEGYLIRFNKLLLQNAHEEFYCSFVSALCPLPGKGEKIRVDSLFLNEGRVLCEMMLQEYICQSDFKMDVLRGLLSIFLLHLTRRSDVVMFVGDSSERRTYAMVC